MSVNLFNDYPLSWRPKLANLRRPYSKSLVNQMRVDIDNGKLLPGMKLPPQRELADFLELGFSTITRAYKLSQKLGITYGVVGKGTFVAKNVKSVQTISRNNAANIKELGFNSSFEFNNYLVKSTAEAVVRKNNFVNLLNYEDPTGQYQHKLIADNYMNKVGMTVNKHSTMIVSGGQNALTVILLGLFNSGDKIAVDKFTYSNLIELARMRGVELIPIADDLGGMSVVELEKQCRNNKIKGIYLMPDCSNPTTITMSNERRRALAEIINRYQLVLIEDDYLNFLNLYREQFLLKVSNLVPERSVYVCSMSKTLVSGLRVCFIRVAAQFKRVLENAIFNTNVKTSALDVDIVTSMLSNGTADKIMHAKIALILEANTIFNEVFSVEPTNNDLRFFRTIKINSQLSGNDIEQLLLEQGIRAFHSDRFLVGAEGPTAFLRISLTSMPKINELRLALVTLRTILVNEQLMVK